MTINVDVTVAVDNWTNIHTEAGVAIGVKMVLQTKGDAEVIFKNAAVIPTDEEGGWTAKKENATVLSEPEATEYTWGLSRGGSSVVKVQS